jgi:hypothetical protein
MLKNTKIVEGYGGYDELNGFKYIFYGKSSVNSNVAKNGWSVKELTHTWSIGSYSELLLPKAEILDNHLIKINASSFGNQNVTVFLNGKIIDKVYIDGNTGFKDIDIILPKNILNYSNDNLLRFEYHHPKSPKSLGLNADNRSLAMAIKEISVRVEGANNGKKEALNESKSLNSKSLLLQDHGLKRTNSINWKIIENTKDGIKVPISKNSDELILQVTNKSENKFAKITIYDDSGEISDVLINCTGDTVRSIKLRNGAKNKFIYIKNSNENSLIINKVGIRNSHE